MARRSESGHGPPDPRPASRHGHGRRRPGATWTSASTCSACGWSRRRSTSTTTTSTTSTTAPSAARPARSGRRSRTRAAACASGAKGAGQVVTTSFSVPAASLGFWRAPAARARRRGARRRVRVSAKRRIRIDDPSGLWFELVGTDRDARAPWTGNGVGADEAIRGLHSVTMVVRSLAPTLELMTGLLGYHVVDEAEQPHARGRGRRRPRPRHRHRRRPGRRPRPSTASAPCTTWRWRSRPTTSSGASARNCCAWACGSPTFAIAATSSRSTSASRAACCSRWPRSSPGSRSTKTCRRSGAA